MRFEPGQERTVQLVEYAGSGHVYGFQGKVMGKVINTVAANTSDKGQE